MHVDVRADLGDNVYAPVQVKRACSREQKLPGLLPGLGEGGLSWGALFWQQRLRGSAWLRQVQVYLWGVPWARKGGACGCGSGTQRGAPAREAGGAPRPSAAASGARARGPACAGSGGALALAALAPLGGVALDPGPPRNQALQGAVGRGVRRDR